MSDKDDMARRAQHVIRAGRLLARLHGHMSASEANDLADIVATEEGHTFVAAFLRIRPRGTEQQGGGDLAVLRAWASAVAAGVQNSTDAESPADAFAVGLVGCFARDPVPDRVRQEGEVMVRAMMEAGTIDVDIVFRSMLVTFLNMSRS